MNQHTTEFVQNGFTQVAPSTQLAAWVAKVRELADADAHVAPLTRWHNNGEFHVPPMPAVPVLDDTLAEILVGAASFGPVCQLSTLSEGYGSEYPNEYSNRHVDGAHGELAWSGMLVGINLTDIPPEGAGNLLVWRGTHRATQDRFDALAGPLTVEAVQQAIRSHEATGMPIVLSGPAGTVTLMDHRLEHAMAPHRIASFKRHVAYFRLPDFTADPNEVVDPFHFLRHG